MPLAFLPVALTMMHTRHTPAVVAALAVLSFIPAALPETYQRDEILVESSVRPLPSTGWIFGNPALEAAREFLRGDSGEGMGGGARIAVERRPSPFDIAETREDGADFITMRVFVDAEFATDSAAYHPCERCGGLLEAPVVIPIEAYEKFLDAVPCPVCGTVMLPEPHGFVVTRYYRLRRTYRHRVTGKTHTIPEPKVEVVGCFTEDEFCTAGGGYAAERARRRKREEMAKSQREEGGKD